MMEAAVGRIFDEDDRRTRVRAQALEAFERGDERALAMLADALQQQPHNGGLLIAEARARSAIGDSQALSRLEEMLRQAPDWLDGQVALAQLRWEAGQRDTYLEGFEAALRCLPRHAGLWFRYMNAIAASGDTARAADVARRLRQQSGDSPPLRLIEAQHAGTAGDLARAGELLATIPDDLPGAVLERARHKLRCADPAAAASIFDEARTYTTLDSSGWALVELAWRASGDSRHAWLIDPGRHVGTHDLGLSQTELQSLADVLRQLHRFGGEPLGQSVRTGTQTRGNLWRRHEPELIELHERLRQAVRRFTAELPPTGPEHPLRRCLDAEPHLTTGWSIRLLGGGHHVAHIHAHGVLSSACYIAVPADAEGQEGWLELGRPPADIPLPLAPLAVLEARPGRLILFPSYLYHGTRPFRLGERLTVAFDVEPVPVSY